MSRKINVGDKVYMLMDRLDFKQYQVEAIVTEIKTIKLLKRNQTAKLFIGEMTGDGSHASTYYSEIFIGKRRILIRKHPFPNAQIFTTRQQKADFSMELWNNRDRNLVH